MRKRLKNIGALLLLVLFAGYWSCVTLFPHVHRIDGLLYVHSHPYSGPAGNPTHSHSAQQFQLIAHLSLLVMALATLAALVRRPEGRTFLSARSAPHAVPSRRCGAARSGPLPASEQAPAPLPEGSITPAVPPHPVHILHYMPCACPVHALTPRALSCIRVRMSRVSGCTFRTHRTLRAPRLRAAPPRRPAVPHPCGTCNPPFTTQRNNPT